ncbi:MAG TPA: CoA pyrophosphatase [Candidatus Limnocylindria bacterium]|jgi:8-oxo-dGTP pyrophosphatase MutT (NUDIX family)|nr:CoA pyrophosphatase [Candidatus Limnocylindria bacterium]
MERILRAHAGWEEEVAEALRRAPRPIPLDERLLPRTLDGNTTRRRYDRSGFPPARPAATLLALYPGEDGELVAPLTIRRSELRAHAGEVSLPGGAIDAGDASAEAAALREAWEEVGLDPSLVRVLGRLDPVWIPVSNFELEPFVGAVSRRPTLVPHDAEVAAIVELPVRALFDPAVLADEEFDARGITVRAGAYRHGEVVVWGATAITLGMFAHVLAAVAPGA